MTIMREFRPDEVTAAGRERSRMIAVLLVVALVATWNAPARAQVAGSEGMAATQGDNQPAPWEVGVSPAQRKAARALMDEGNRLIKIPLFAQAAAKFEEALQHWDHPALHYNLGIAYLNLVQPMESYKSFAKALRYGPEPLGQDKFAQAQSYMKILAARLARVEVVCEIAGAEVTLDGEPLFIGPGKHEQLVSPGRHQLLASKPDHVPDNKQITLVAGERASHVLMPRSVDEVARRERRWAAWKPWTVVAVGAGLLAGAGYLDWRSSRDFEAFDRDFEAANCVPRGCNGQQIPELAASVDTARTKQWAALGLYGAGGVAVLVGAALVYFNREHLVRRNDADRELSIVPMMTVDGGGVSARIHF